MAEETNAADKAYSPTEADDQMWHNRNLKVDHPSGDVKQQLKTQAEEMHGE
jgi:hypothetical protein